jgi:uncharacterized protein YcaQ
VTANVGYALFEFARTKGHDPVALARRFDLELDELSAISALRSGAHKHKRRSSARRLGSPARWLAPFDSIVWDRRRFELLWGWAYRFEAYTPASKRVRRYYALPMLWRDCVLGWANASVVDQALEVKLGCVDRSKRGRPTKTAIDEERERMARFLHAR